MKTIETIITLASWEDRFLLGLTKILEKTSPKMILMFYMSEYSSWTLKNRKTLIEYCKSRNIIIKPQMLSFEKPTASWLKIHEILTEENLIIQPVLVDISTMPREIIWSIFRILKSKFNTINYVYNSPEKYNQEWLSRDPSRPRIVYKLGGISDIGLPTTLLVLTGYDIERVKQLVSFFEPKDVFLGIQEGAQFENDTRNYSKYLKAYRKRAETHTFLLDVYKDDHGYSSIQSNLIEYFDNSNIIMSSLGPKLSAIALYRLHINHPKTALAYAPSKDFNRNYSDGLGGTYIGHLDL